MFIKSFVIAADLFILLLLILFEIIIFFLFVLWPFIAIILLFNLT